MLISEVKRLRNGLQIGDNIPNKSNKTVPGKTTSKNLQ